jgi:hypothetical protein
LAIATHIGKAEVVGENEDDVRPSGLGRGTAQSVRRNGKRARSAGKQIASRKARSVLHWLLPSAKRPRGLQTKKL